MLRHKVRGLAIAWESEKMSADKSFAVFRNDNARDRVPIRGLKGLPDTRHVPRRPHRGRYDGRDDQAPWHRHL